VKREEQVYIPNVITPDNDGINDVFTIFGGPAVIRIREMIIFDRWGGKIFQLSGFPAGDPAYGWDGRHNGKPVSAGVYVFYAEVEYLNGEVESFSGDVTVFR
jgi:gliding motility-associated-like protein